MTFKLTPDQARALRRKIARQQYALAKRRHRETGSLRDYAAVERYKRTLKDQGASRADRMEALRYGR